MTKDLQHLLDKIQHDGVAKAKAEGDVIVADAKAKADALVKAAEAQAEKLRADSKRDAEAFVARSQDTLRQSARDVQLSIEQAVTAQLVRVLATGVDAALSDPAITAQLAAEAIKAYLGGETIAVATGTKLADALRAALAAQKTVSVVTDDTLGTGFSVRCEGGRVEHDFTGPAVSAALAKLLRPQLAALLK